jgi:lipopolysaccharide/colanic/teichoic acid biosynthesis glycosyltransferase
MRSYKIKYLGDFFLSFPLLLVTAPFILFLIFAASCDTRSFGLFRQKRVGQFGRPFYLYKIKSMRNGFNPTGVSALDYKRLTRFGRLLRHSKLDELPQLYNIVTGSMSFVGPRADVPGFADALIGRKRKLLSLKPGVTGLATLLFRDEEQILSCVDDPVDYNRNVIWPRKVELNLVYLDEFSLFLDVKILIATLFPFLRFLLHEYI